VRGTNLSRDAQAGSLSEFRGSDNEAVSRRLTGVRTQVLLVLAMALVTVIVTALCVFLIRHRLREQVSGDLAQDLKHSVITFEDLQAERLGALDRENSLLAELPTIKALMTSGDKLTIQDGAVEFWQLSGNDLFALADPDGRVVAAYAKATPPDDALRRELKMLVESPGKHYLINGRSLYACSLRPIYFGNDEDGTLLGYVISGISIERTVRQISQPTGVEATFLSEGHVVASTLGPEVQASLATQPALLSAKPGKPSTVRLGNTKFLTDTEDLSRTATSPLQLVLLKSFEPAERWIDRIDSIVWSTGLLALLAGTVLMITLSRLLTRPLEELSRSVRAFGMGDSAYRIPRYGTQEVRQLSTAFAGMRDEIQQANHALVESERLATIGRMASSVSHDLRHYLAAVYANAEFLASDRLGPEERAEIFADIRAAVHGTTDMIESLLIFSRTGTSVRRVSEAMNALLERAAGLIRAHPDAEGIKLATYYGDSADTVALVDGMQIERAIYNLLLNACQAVRSNGPSGHVKVALEIQGQYIIVNVIDNGAGVPENIRKSLFEPFVSEGKQKGTGLGLTLAHRIAVEHGGGVILLSSSYGETIFQMKVARAIPLQPPMGVLEGSRADEVIANEKAWT
jgi:signal transduction histidine kinase